jgi:ATP-dependent Clp protease adapter protein ClpS
MGRQLTFGDGVMSDQHETRIDPAVTSEKEYKLIPPTEEQVRDILFNTPKDVVVQLAAAFFNSTAISKTKSWDNVLLNDPQTTMFFVGGTFRVILALRNMLYKKEEAKDVQKPG